MLFRRETAGDQSYGRSVNVASQCVRKLGSHDATCTAVEKADHSFIAEEIGEEATWTVFEVTLGAMDMQHLGEELKRSSQVPCIDFPSQIR